MLDYFTPEEPLYLLDMELLGIRVNLDIVAKMKVPTPAEN
jgi:hypothetical protein